TGLESLQNNIGRINTLSLRDNRRQLAGRWRERWHWLSLAFLGLGVEVLPRDHMTRAFLHFGSRWYAVNRLQNVF
ncbi:MAG: hypothetical protein QGF90_10070, partial [Gammaproteobacteria bacterium]|nr:hypothetical protein [Gammaproteobacteria bacterium]